MPFVECARPSRPAERDREAPAATRANLGTKYAVRECVFSRVGVSTFLTLHMLRFLFRINYKKSVVVRHRQFVSDSIVASIPACHAGDLGSIPSQRACYFAAQLLSFKFNYWAGGLKSTKIIILNTIIYIINNIIFLNKVTSNKICDLLNRRRLFTLTNDVLYSFLFPLCCSKKGQSAQHDISDSIVASIPACHAGDLGSIPSQRA